MTEPIFPDIDYPYWSERNAFFSDVPFTDTVRIGLAHSRKAGLIGPLLERNKVETNGGLVSLIRKQISQFSFYSTDSDRDLLVIFDLIQGWGGKMGRGPYCRPRGSPVRMNFAELPFLYAGGVQHCLNGSYRMALEALLKIKYVGESFATKHIYFWSSFGPGGRAFPIYDTRIKTLLFLNPASAPDYVAYVHSLELKAKEQSIEVERVERALFAFSQNYFGNDDLKVIDAYIDRTNLNEALGLQERYLLSRFTERSAKTFQKS